MKKRWCALLCAVCLFVGLFSGCSAAPQESERLSEEALNALTQSRQETHEKTPPTIAVGGVPAIYETEEQCYYWSISDDREWEKLLLSLPDEQDSEKTVAFAQDFTAQPKSALLRKNEPIPIVVYDDTTYQLYDMKFSSLPLLSVETQTLPDEYVYVEQADTEDADAPDLSTVEGKIEALQATTEEPTDDEDTYDPHTPPPSDPNKPIGEDDVFASVTLLDASAQSHGYENGFTSMARLHLRGRSSRAYPKNSYKLELLKEDKDNPGVLVERNKTLLGMRDDGDWVLNGMYAEPTKLRDYVSSRVWLNITADRTAQGLSTGYRTEYIEVFINGRYRGLYLLSERIDRKQLALEQDDRMYFSEGDVGKKYWDFLNLDEQKMTRRGYSLKWPKERSEPYDEWQAFSDFVFLIDNTDRDAFIKEAATGIDFDSAIDYWIFVQMTAAVDNLIQNTFYVADKQEDGSYQFSFVPWDMDQTFGSRWSGEEPWYTWEDYTTAQEIWHFWVTDRLLDRNPDGFKAALLERYRLLREEAISDNALLSLMQEAQTKLQSSGAFARNQDRWPNGAYQSELTEIRRYTINRTAFLDTEVKRICLSSEG